VPATILEELAAQQRELKEELATVLDCLHAAGLLTPCEVAMQRQARRSAVVMREFLRTSTLVQRVSAFTDLCPFRTSFAPCCSAASAGVRSLLLLPDDGDRPSQSSSEFDDAGASTSAGDESADRPSCPGEGVAAAAAQEDIMGSDEAPSVVASTPAADDKLGSVDGSSTTAEGPPNWDEDVDMQIAGEDSASVAERAPQAAEPPAQQPETPDLPADGTPQGGPQPTIRRGLTAKLLSGLLLGWRPSAQDGDNGLVDPAEHVALQMPGILRNVARLAGFTAARHLVEASGRAAVEALVGSGLLRELARRGRSIYVCSGSCGAPAESVDCFDPSSSSWEGRREVPRMRVPRRACAVASTGGQLYVMGGVDVGTPLEDAGNRPERLDLATGSWTLLPPMGRQYTHAAAAAAGGMVYVFGGLSCGSVLDQAHRFDPVHNVWECLEPMPTPRFECAAATARGELFVVGGANVCGDPLAAAECFSPATGRWQALPPLASPRFGCAAASVRGIVYIIGGHGFWESLSEVECFDPASGGSWRWLPPMPVPRNRCGAAAAGGRIYVFGGNSQGADAHTVDCFDPEAGEWLAAVPGLLGGRGGHCMAAAVSS